MKEFQESYDVSEEELQEWDTEEPLPIQKHSRLSGTQLLLIIQIAVCIAIICGVLVFKLIGGEQYNSFREWYKKKINQTVIASENEPFYEAVWNSIFGTPGEENSSTGTPQDTTSTLQVNLTQAFSKKEQGAHLCTTDQAGNQIWFSVWLTAPLEQGVLTSPFGTRADPFTGEQSFHNGLDIGADENTPIYSALPGTVSRVVSEDPYYGNYVEVDHGNGIVTRYAHCNSLLVEKGQQVERGDEIATVGSTGKSTGNHLHFTVFLHDVPCDPAPLLPVSYAG